MIELTRLRQGLVLVTGATGQGKSTTLASLLDRINQERQVHIVTLEDPIEYLFQHKSSIVVQRELGTDSISFATGLRSALREDPDVILVGEMRDFHTIEAALTAAETGHLVFATLHTKTPAQGIDRVVDVFPPHQQQQVKRAARQRAPRDRDPAAPGAEGRRRPGPRARDADRQPRHPQPDPRGQDVPDPVAAPDRLRRPA